jgi:hypothetical protein
MSKCTSKDVVEVETNLRRLIAEFRGVKLTWLDLGGVRDCHAVFQFRRDRAAKVALEAAIDDARRRLLRRTMIGRETMTF